MWHRFPHLLTRAGLLLLAVSLATGAATADETPPLEAGFAVVDLTPAEPVPLGGYAARRGRPFRSVHDPVKARVVALRCGETSLALVALDLVGVSARVREVVSRRVADLDFDDVVLAATHTHAGPGALTDVGLWRVAMGAFDRHLFARTASRIEAAIRWAHADLAPVSAAAMRVDSSVLASLVRNRATPGAEVDASLGVLRFDAPDGTPRGVLVHFASHPTLLPASVRDLSAGWPGALCDALEREIPGATAIFLNGAMGDVAPVAPATSEGGPFERARTYGEALAACALQGHETLGRVLQARGSATGLRVHGTHLGYAYTAAGALLGREGASALTPGAWALPVARFAIGDVDFVTVPGEPTQAVGRTLGQGPTYWVVSCAQDHLGYFADRALFRRGDTYEAELSLFGPSAAEVLATAAAGHVPPPRSRPASPPANEGPFRIGPCPDEGSGGARALGRAHGEILGPLVRDFLARAEEYLVREALRRGGGVLLLPVSLTAHVPSRDLIVPLLVRAVRKLQPFIPSEYLDEMEGLAQAAGVPYDAILLENTFLTLAEQPDPVHLLQLPAHCTNVVALGDATSMGQVLHASSLDWGMREVLKDRVVVLVTEPARGHPFVSITWPGMVGTLRAMGAQGIAVTEESCAAPADTRFEGTPVGFLLRRVVQHASDLQEAVRLVKETPGTCGYKITISDGRALDARVVEVTATHHQVRRPVNGLLFGCDPGAGATCFDGARDPAILPNDGSSARRYPAVRRLLETRHGRVRRGLLQEAITTPEGGVRNENTLLACVFEPQTGAFHVARGRDLPLPPAPVAWQAHELGTYLSPRARARAVPPWPVETTGLVETRLRIASFAGIRVEAVTFRSPVRSGIEANDVVEAELLTPHEPIGVVIQLPHWKEPRNAPGQRLLALSLARQGFAVLLLPLPYQYDRAPEGVRSGHLTLSHDLARTREASFQAAADVARVSHWLEETRGFPPERQALFGVSLGGHVASLAMGAYPDRFDAGVFLLTGAGIATTLLQENGITDGIRTRLVERGVTAEEAGELLQDLDPARHARRELADHVLLVAGTADPVTPRPAVEALARAWGGAHVHWFEGGHYGIVRHAPGILAAVAAHLRRCFEGP